MTPINDPVSSRTASSGAAQGKAVQHEARKDQVPQGQAVKDSAAQDKTAKDQAPPTQAIPDPREQLATLLPNLRAFAISLSRNVVLADDIVQETILKAWSNMDKFDPTTNLEAWLFTILRNTYYSFLRKTRREVQDSDGAFAASLSVAPAHDGRLAYGDFQRAFDQLSPEHREVLILIGASGYSVEEAAQMMGVAPGTVKSRASRARKRLSELMGLAEGEDLFSGFNSIAAAVISRPATPAT